MKILLVSPCINPEKKTPTGLMIPQLALHILDGMTPADFNVKIVEEEFEEINLNEECDLVGISCMTANAPRAYYLAEEFRKRGKKVVIGGVHPSILPDEAGKYADSVVIGEAEGVWESILHDFKNGNLKSRYHFAEPELDRYIPLDFSKAKGKRPFNIVPIMTTRGCPYKCDFCCVNTLFGKRIRHAPIENIVRTIKETNAKTYIFLDDNIIGNRTYAKNLFRAIKPLGIRWVGQASLTFVKDIELMDLAAKSGCKGLFFGVESVSENQLGKMRKSIKKIDDLKDAIKSVKKLGIYFHASFIFGFDDDTKSVFSDTLKFMEDQKIGAASFNVLTPYPGTKVYEDLKAQGRLLTDDWKHYDHCTVVYRPKNMSPYELQTGKIWLKKEFTRIPSIIKRFTGNMSHPLLFISMNYGIRKNIQRDIDRLPELISEVFEAKGDTSHPRGENLLYARHA